MNALSSNLQPNFVRANSAKVDSSSSVAVASPDGFSPSNLSEALAKEQQYQPALKQQQLAMAAAEQQNIEDQLAAAAQVKEQNLSRAEHNSIALDQLNDSKPVKQLAEFLETYDQRLNQGGPLFDNKFYYTSVPLSADRMVISRDGFEDCVEGWLTLDGSGIHLVQQQDRVMGEDCYFDMSSSSVRPWAPVRFFDKLLGHHNGEVLARVDMPTIEERIALAIQDTKQLAGNPSADGAKVVKTIKTNNPYNTFDSL